MRNRLQTRLEELKKEFATGQTHFQELERQQMNLRQTMLRISGAIQVLEELLADELSLDQHGAHSGEKQLLSGQVNPGNITGLALQTLSLEVMTTDQDRTAQQ